MSTPILPFAVWEEGTNQNSIPANDNALRSEILNGLVISDTTDAQPGSPADGDIYIITGAATGAQWATFDEFDLAIFKGGTWYAYAPVEGIVVNLDGVLNEWTGTAYAAVGGGGGGAVDSVNGQTGTVVLTDRNIVSGINAQTGTTYTAALTDETVTMDNASANTLTIPPNSSVAFVIGRSLEVWQKGAGQTTIAAGAGVTILYHADNTLKLKGQNSGCSLRKMATDTWRLIGDMEQV